MRVKRQAGFVGQPPFQGKRLKFQTVISLAVRCRSTQFLSSGSASQAEALRLTRRIIRYNALLLEGRVETRYGPGLRKSVIHEAGDFIFIPADVPHQPVNLSATEAARALVARNDPNEQESVVPYDPASEA